VSAKSRGLGRGLDALLPKVEKDPDLLPLTKLKPAKNQPRKTFDPGAIADLAASIREKGVLQPILVRPAGEKFEIVAGERRYRAAKEAGLAQVPVIVRELDDREVLEVAIIENLQREDLNPVEEAYAFQELMNLGLTQEAVAQSVGKSRSSVANVLRLLQLPEAALEALRNGEISAGHARAILAQPEGDQLWALQKIVEGDLTVRQAEALRRTAITARRSASDERYRELEESLARHAGTKVKVSGGDRGKIELHFYSQDELERLLELLGFEV